jgi:aspartyl protease family protein
MIGWALRQVLIWGAAAAVLYVVVVNELGTLPQTGAPVRATSAPVAARTPSVVPNSLVFHANRQGHVLLSGAVNGSSVRFIVDTGATMVVLTPSDATAAGLDGSQLVYNVRTSTANGAGRAAAVTLREIRIGQFSVYDVPAFVVENVPMSLLGQSFLTRLSSYEMRDGALTLNWN